jgi:hypothetical protein
MKCNIGGDISFILTTMMRVINKVLPLVSSEPNIMEIADHIQQNSDIHSKIGLKDISSG